MSVLVISDDPVYASVFQQALALPHLNVHVANTAAIAGYLLGENTYALVIQHGRLPKASDLDRWLLRRALRDGPMLITTISSEAHTPEFQLVVHRARAILREQPFGEFLS